MQENINQKTNFEIENYYKLKSLIKNSKKQNNNSRINKNIKQGENLQNYMSGLRSSSISVFFYDKDVSSGTVLKNLINIIVANQKKYGKDFINIKKEEDNKSGNLGIMRFLAFYENYRFIIGRDV